MRDLAVIDVGCDPRGGDSMGFLRRKYKPAVLIGLDPGVLERDTTRNRRRTITFAAAAWTFTGSVAFKVTGRDGFGRVSDDGVPIPCLDLAELVLGWAETHDVVLKVDAEGAEWFLLDHLAATGANESLRECWVEWHCPKCLHGVSGADHLEWCDADFTEARGVLELAMGCVMHEWNR